jgi:hypothetical protein
MSVPTHKLLTEHAALKLKLSDLKKQLMKPASRKYYPTMDDDKWAEFVETFQVQAKKKKRVTKKPKIREEPE